jgi:hypothetical protein
VAISSYILYPVLGKEVELQNVISSWACTVQIASSHDKSVFVLVTDTPNEFEEKKVKQMLFDCNEVDYFTLTYANNEL